MKNIVITGALGQDGIILSKILIKNKFKVFGLVNNLNKKIKTKVRNVKYFEISDNKFENVKNLLDNIKPDIILHLGSNNPSFRKILKNRLYKNLIYKKIN